MKGPERPKTGPTQAKVRPKPGFYINSTRNGSSVGS